MDFPHPSSTDGDIRPPTAVSVTYLALDYGHDREEAALIFDAIASRLSAYVAFTDPVDWPTNFPDPTPPRNWWIGLPPIRAHRWWFGPEYVRALADELPGSASMSAAGAVVSEPKWRPPRRVCFIDFTREEFDDLERQIAATNDPAEEQRLRWKMLLWVHPAAEIPTPASK